MSKRFLTDLAERVGATYVETFVGLVIASGIGTTGVDNLSIVTKAAVAAIPAALAVGKAAFASLRGRKDSASLVSTVAT